MAGRLSECRLFFREFRQHFHTTGAILPSGRPLCKALARYVRQTPVPKRVLEVGPGTGAVTRWILDGLGTEDRLDLVELNESFVKRLRERFETEPNFQALADRARVLHGSVEDLPADAPYDVIVSGLPLNNFSVAMVDCILDALCGLGRPGGTLSFFEYIAIRRVRALTSGRTERDRLRGIGRVLNTLLEGREIRRERVCFNIPPAWVHHVSLGGNQK